MSSTKKLRAAHRAFCSTISSDVRIKVYHTVSQVENNNPNGKDKTQRKSARPSIGFRRK